MFKQKEQRKSKFKKCSNCKTETVLAICPHCKKDLGKSEIDLTLVLQSKAAKRKLRRLERKNNGEEK